ITFWPLAEIVREAAGILERDEMAIAEEKLCALAGDGEVVARVASAIGLSDSTFPVQELIWGARKLLEVIARASPLVAVFDDIHWAETTFLELVEHVVEAATEPLLLVCTTRHELLDRAPAWSTGQTMSRIELEPLTEEQAGVFEDHLLGDASLDTNDR